jgi:long-chain acyl-CoA synthetase
MTECVSVACLTPRFAAKYDTIGVPFPATLFKIVTPGTTEAVPTGTPGEICISGPTVMLGYLNDPEETKKVLQPHPDGRLWLHTGDLGHMDEEGFIYFHQRQGRMILCNGYNIYPCQLEKALSAQEYVEDVCVIGIPDPKRGQIPKAFVVLKKGILPDENTRHSLLAHCAKHIAAYAIPKEIAFLPALPKTAMGKTDYRALEQSL